MAAPQIELHLSKARVQDALETMFQQSLFNTLIDPLPGGLYVDHIDVVRSTAASSIKVTGGAVAEGALQVKVFFVTHADVLAAPLTLTGPESAPPRMFSNSVTLGIYFKIKLEDERWYLELSLAELPAEIPELLQTQIRAIATRRLDLSTLSPLFSLFPGGDPFVLDGARLMDGPGDALVVVLNPQGPVVGALKGTQQWGVFLPATWLEQQASIIAKGVESEDVKFVGAHWSPSGENARIQIQMHASWSIFEVDVHGSVSIALQPNGILQVRGPVDGIEGESIFDDIALAVAKIFSSEFERRFERDVLLPPMKLLGFELSPSSALASPEGLMLGGRIPAQAFPEFSLRRGETSTWYNWANIQTGCPGRTPKLGRKPADVSSGASFELASAGISEPGTSVIQPPGVDLELYLQATPTGTVALRLTAAIAFRVPDSIKVLVRYPRGVRVLDFGTPPPVELDPAGDVIGSVAAFLKNCLRRPAGLGSGIFGGFGSIFQEPGTTDGPPLRGPGTGGGGGPDWYRSVFADNVLVTVAIYEFDDLAPGELLEFRSTDHRVLVAADTAGRVRVPVILTESNRHSASLTRMSQQELPVRAPAVDITLRRVGFARTNSAGSSLFASRSAMPSSLSQGAFAQVVPLPGLGEIPMRVAVSKDGRQLLLDGDRVCGTIDGLLAEFEMHQDWAVVANREGRLRPVFQVSSNRQECGCSGVSK